MKRRSQLPVERVRLAQFFKNNFQCTPEVIESLFCGIVISPRAQPSSKQFSVFELA